jgi:predicted transcriptional regulator of viral defense system
MRDLAAPARDERLAKLATAQQGVISVGQLYMLGFDRDAVARRVRSGRLHRIHRGVYAVGHTVLNRNARYLAAVLAAGDGAVLSHRSAAVLWNIHRSNAAKIDVTVPRICGFRSTPTIAVHRPRLPPAQTTHAGIPVTTPGRTLQDLATGVPRRTLEKAAEMAEALRLHVELDPHHPGAARLDAVLEQHDLDHTTRSPLEDDFLVLCDRHGIPRPLVNTYVEGFEVDFVWPEARLIVETDSRTWHGTAEAFERDRARDARLTVAGWRVVRFTRRRVRAEAGGVADLLVRLLEGPTLASLPSAVDVRRAAQRA